eukprot:CAMPEP_0113500210 /NCGR_PEP_ID=MMETSP0014_2-20120614/32181_1 /TAXON_ID=2857 /ORGANISM="Nitzschia sp." /LENGTH=364 /DNA_ID=CAMNT_0000394479 /DNA_START=133 /DNA_END=1229 /DNA_ORIENTATION=+ /assembly_acc=CAM_ASM_000159
MTQRHGDDDDDDDVTIDSSTRIQFPIRLILHDDDDPDDDTNDDAELSSSRNRNRRRRRVSPTTLSSSSSDLSSLQAATGISDDQVDQSIDIEDDDDGDEDEDDDDDDDDSLARSQFGTKLYWDEMYQGRGDFPSDEYQWYYGWDEIKSIVEQYTTHAKDDSSTNTSTSSSDDILVLGIGNDPVLLDLLQVGYTKLTATDYSEHAIERQQDLLDFGGYGDYVVDVNDEEEEEEDISTAENDGGDETQSTTIELRQMDARKMDPNWTEKFNLILEKGCLDAIYLSGDGHLERVERELFRILQDSSRKTGILVSVSGVVPDDVRRTVFDKERWTWLRDGADDLKAGKFVLAPKKQKNTEPTRRRISS